MIAFACAACQKQISVKDDLAGKKGKCPCCGQPVAVPSAAGRGSAAAAAAAATVPPSSSHEATHGGAASSELTERLSPPQAAS